MPHLSPYVRELVLTGSPACEDFPVLEICDVMETSAHFGHARSMELAYLALRSCGHPEGRDLLRFQHCPSFPTAPRLFTSIELKSIEDDGDATNCFYMLNVSLLFG